MTPWYVRSLRRIRERLYRGPMAVEITCRIAGSVGVVCPTCFQQPNRAGFGECPTCYEIMLGWGTFADGDVEWRISDAMLDELSSAVGVDRSSLVPGEVFAP